MKILQKKILLLSLVVIFILSLIIFDFIPQLFAGNIKTNLPFHSTIEAFGAFASLIFGLLIYNLKSYKEHIDFYWLALALFSMGILDFSHALSPEGNNFVLFHSASVFLGGFFSSLILFQKFSFNSKTKRTILLSVTVFITAISLFLVFNPAYGLLMFSEGEFTNVAKLLNLAGGGLFTLSAVFFFLKYYRTSSKYYYFYGIFSTLMALGGITFLNDEIWTVGWWFWHEIRLSAFVMAIIIVFLNYKLLTSNSLKNEQELTKQNNEYLTLNEELASSDEELRATNEELRVSEIELREINEELRVSEEEIRATNEELITTSDALVESNSKLVIAKERAEESDRLKTEFINNMSHEIRTPMNGILGFSHMLNKPDKSEEKKKQYINIIQSSGKQLMRIIDDILEISKLGTKQVKTIEKEICLNDLLLEQFSIFDIKAKENKIPLYLKKGLSDKKSIILTDETKLNKILSNLLENALKFTNEGFIEFGYNLVETHARASLQNDNGVSLQIYVKDTGIGVKSESQKTIFDRFSQEEKEVSKIVGGLGLGLSIAKENAELLDGEITLESEKGKGATFFITIPYKPVQESIDTTALNYTINETEKLKEYKVLIVEDEEINHLYLEEVLSDFDINIKTLHAKHGEEAIELCKENPDTMLVLMDLKMPIMNGFIATKRIKEFRPNLPIIAQTAYSTEKEQEQAFLAGCNDFASKPITEETLSQIINKYLVTE